MDELGEAKRVFNYGDALRDMTLSTAYTSTNALWFVIVNPQTSQLNTITVPGLIPLHQWCHIAGVSGSGGMKLYFNGAVVGTNSYTGSFASLE